MFLCGVFEGLGLGAWNLELKGQGSRSGQAFWLQCRGLQWFEFIQFKALDFVLWFWASG